MARVPGLVLALLVMPWVASAAQLHPTERNAIFESIRALDSAEEHKVEAARKALRAKGDKAVPFLIDALEVSSSEAVRMEAATLLGEFRNETALSPLFVASQVDPSPRVRMAAQLAAERLVADLNEPRAEDTRWRDYEKVTRGTVIEIRKRLKGDPDARVRVHAARSLGVYGAEKDIDFLYDRARRDDDSRVRIACYEAIRRLTYPIVLARDFRDLTSEPAERSRNQIAERTTKQMLARLEDEDDADVRVAIVENLAECVYPIFLLGEHRLHRSSTAFDDHRWVIDEITTVFTRDLDKKSTDDDVKRAEIRALIRLLTAYYRVGDTNLQDEVRRRLTSEFKRDYLFTNTTYKSIIVRIRFDRHYRSSPPENDRLAERVTKAAKDLFLDSTDWRNRQLAAEATGLFGDKADSITIMKGLSTERNHDVMETAIGALGRLDRNASATSLLKLYTNLDAPDRLRAAAARAIGQIHYPRETHRLAGLVAREPSLDVRLAVIEALSYNRDEIAARALTGQLLDDKPEIRAAALIALQYNPHAGALNAIQHLLLNDPDPNVRAVAAAGLSILAKKNAVPALTRALADESPHVRLAAAVELGLLEAPSALEPLVALATGDPDPDVRIEAATSLGQLGDRRAIEPLVRQALVEKEAINRKAIYSALLLMKEPNTVIVSIWQKLPELQRTNPVIHEELQVLIVYLRAQNRGRNVEFPG